MPGPEAAGPILNGLPSRLPDIDPEETAEWLASLDAAVDEQGRTRARYLMLALLQRARERGTVGNRVLDGRHESASFQIGFISTPVNLSKIVDLSTRHRARRLHNTTGWKRRSASSDNRKGGFDR